MSGTARGRVLGTGSAVALPALLVVAGANLAANLAADLRTPDEDFFAALANWTQWLLMPALAWALWSATGATLVRGQRSSRGRRPVGPGVARRSRTVRLVLVALAFSWLGDTAPDVANGDAAFLVMVAFFLGAQVAYVVAFWPFRRASVLARPIALVPYGAALVALVVACAPGAGSLLVPVVVYGMCLVATAVLATGVGRIAGIGGIVFLVSDALIALRAFVPGFALPFDDFWVMLTYVVGQALLVEGVLRSERRSGD